MERKNMNLWEKLSEYAKKAKNAKNIETAKYILWEYCRYYNSILTRNSYKIWLKVAFIQYPWTDIERNVTWIITKIVDDKKLWYSFFLWEERFYPDELSEVQTYRE